MANKERNRYGTDQPVNGPIPAAGSGTEMGTPRPNTGLDTGRTEPKTASGMPIDPDFGLDPYVQNPEYGGGDSRGRADLVAQADDKRMGLEDSPPRGNAADAETTGGMARGGDTTSTANTHDDFLHGLGEVATRGLMSEGVTNPGAAGTGPETPGGVDPNDESTFQEGVQHANGPRA